MVLEKEKSFLDKSREYMVSLKRPMEEQVEDKKK